MPPIKFSKIFTENVELVLRNRIEAPLTKSRNLARLTSWMSLKLELGSPPVTPLGVVTNRVACSHTNPLRNRPEKTINWCKETVNTFYN